MGGIKGDTILINYIKQAPLQASSRTNNGEKKKKKEKK